MRILFVGSKDRGVRCLNALIEEGHEIVGVVTAPKDDPNKFWEGSVADIAESKDLPLYTPRDINDESVVNTLQSLMPELIVMSGYNQVLGSAVLDIPADGVINLHAGKLPEYRGGSPMNWAIINGETEGTATIHYATERIDAGAILAEEEFPIDESDTIRDVRNRTLEIFPQLLIEVVSQIEAGTANPREQETSRGTYYCSRTPEDGQINWQRMTAKNVYDFIRALTHPYPGAFTTYRGERLYIWEAELLEESIKHTPGRICMRRDHGRVVMAKDRGLLVKTVQLEKGGENQAASYLSSGEYLQ